MISCFSKFHRKISMNLVGCQVFWRFGTLQDHYIIFKKHWFHFWKHTWFKSVFLRLVSNEKNMMKFADSDVLTFVSTCTDTLMYWQILWRAVSILNPSGRTFETIWVLPAINVMELYIFGMMCFQHKCIVYWFWCTRASEQGEVQRCSDVHSATLARLSGSCRNLDPLSTRWALMDSWGVPDNL